MGKPNVNFRSASYITNTKSKGCFTISEKGKAAPICISGADHTGARKAAAHLKEDIRRVTNCFSELITDAIPNAGEIIVAGTLGKNPIIDELAAEGKIDVSEVSGKREAFVIQTIDAPFTGTKRALVISGSDKRGTMYGMYDLSSRMGVSAWHWWADVPIARRDALYATPGRYTLGEPAVKYRGIFINDEAPALSGWVYETFGEFNHQFYEKVFELILRMKGNYLWPAMWGKSMFDDDPETQALANEYGIVIGTSHHEPLMRAHDEWRRYGNGPWNYDRNEKALREFWKLGIRRMAGNESIVTVGMRGDGDEPMTGGSNIALLERIMADQRSIIGEVTGKKPAEVPQLWAVYKEVQDYYDKGMKVPGDVHMLLCDDNWGNLRRLPRPGQKKHPGGYGIYYHFDYVGGPRNYKWLNTTQIGRVLEQMQLAYEHGVNAIWIVNVGDIKPVEFPTEFFLDYAWFADRWDHGILDDYTELWAREQFGTEHAKTIAAMIETYTKYNSRIKPELLRADTYSLLNYREAESYAEEYAGLADEADDLLDMLDPEYRDAFHQLVLHPIKACANLSRMYVELGKNLLYASQGRAAANEKAETVEALFENDRELSLYYNREMANGKWNHMMDQTHISYTYWQQPEKDTVPETKRLALPDRAEMGVMAEGSGSFFPETKAGLSLPLFDRINGQSFYIDVFNRGNVPFSYIFTPEAKWIRVSGYTGKIALEERLFVEIDWSTAPPGILESSIMIAGPDDKSVSIGIKIDNTEPAGLSGFKGFVEGNGYVSMEAEHYARAVESHGITWQRIPRLGKTLSAMTAYPVTSPSMVPGNDGPRLEYDLFLTSAGKVEVNLYVSPTLDVYGKGGLEFGIGFDDEAPKKVNLHADGSQEAWESWVTDNVIRLKSVHDIKGAGPHVLQFRMIDPCVVLQKIVVDTGGLAPSFLGPPESKRLG